MKSHGINMSVKTYLKEKGGGKILIGELSKLNEQNKIIIENLDGTDPVVFPMKSFVSNFLCKYVHNMFNGFVYYNAPISSYGKFADGTTDFSGGNGNYGLASIAGQNTTGIQVGFDSAGTPVVDSMDYNLAGLINHGNSSGQLYKNAMQGTELGLDSFGSTESEFVIQRDFINNSGADIVINECGFFTNYSSSWTETNSIYFTPNQSVLMARDVFSPITVPAGGGKRVRYVIKLDNTAGLGFNNNFLYTLRSNLSNFSSNVVKNISGEVNSPYAFNATLVPYTAIPNAVGYEGLIYSGLALNTDDTAFLLTDYASTGIIQHGSTSGKLYYNAAVNHDYQGYATSETIWKNTREFQNNSGAPITAKSWMLNSTCDFVGIFSYQIARGIINSGTGVTIPDGDSIILELTISVDTGV